MCGAKGTWPRQKDVNFTAVNLTLIYIPWVFNQEALEAQASVLPHSQQNNWPGKNGKVTVDAAAKSRANQRTGVSSTAVNV